MAQILIQNQVCNNLDVNAGDHVVVSSATAVSTTISGNGANVFISSGGLMSCTNISNNGELRVYESGTADSTNVLAYGKFDVRTGGMATNTTITGLVAMAYVYGGSASKTTVNIHGAYTVGSDGTVTETIVGDRGVMFVSGGGLATDTTVSSGGSFCMTGEGSATDVKVQSGGKLFLQYGENVLSSATVYSGGSAIVSGDAPVSKFLVYGGELHLLSETVMSQSNPADLAVMEGGTLYLRNGCMVDGVVLSNGGCAVVKNTDNTIMNATVTSAELDVYYGGTASGVTLNDHAVLNVIQANLKDITVNSGAVVKGALRQSSISGLTFNGGTLDLSIAKASVNDDYIIDSSAFGGISGDYACTLSVANKQLNGTYKLIEGAAGFDTTVTVKLNGGSTLGTLTVGGGPTDVGNITCDLQLVEDNLVVTVTGGAIPDPVCSGVTLIDERLDITSGMSAIDTKVSSGGILNIYSDGLASNTKIYAGGEFNVYSGGELNVTRIHSGGTATIYEDVVASNVLADGGVFVVESDGWAFQMSKGNLVTSNTTVFNGGQLIINGGGWVEGAYVYRGSVEVRNDGHLSTAIVSSGVVSACCGAIVSKVDLVDAGILNVESGGSVQNINVSSGGILTGVLRDASEIRFYGGTLDLNIANAAPGNEYLVDDLSYTKFITPGENTYACTLTVSGSQANGTYQLIEGAYDFDKAITVQNSFGVVFGTLEIDQTLTYDEVDYTLMQAVDGSLSVTISGSEPTPPEPVPVTNLFFNGDFDNGGRALLAVEKDGTVKIYSNGAEWGSGLSLETGWEVVGTGDFNADKKDDFLRVNTEGYVVGEMSQGDGTFAAQVLNFRNAGWSILGTGDFNGNGSDDVLIANPTAASDTVGLLGYWESGVTWTLINGYSAEWEMVSCGDFNGDGKCDMLWKNEFVGDGGLTYNAYCTWIVENPVDWRMVSVANPAEWNFLCSGDFDGNGSHDIAMINDVGVVGIWGVNDGYLSSWSILSAVTSEWTLAGVADFNGDGTDDIAWSNTDTGLTGYWQINNKELTAWSNLATIG